MDVIAESKCAPLTPTSWFDFVTRDDGRRAASANRFVEKGAWVSLLVLAESTWVLGAPDQWPSHTAPGWTALSSAKSKECRFVLLGKAANGLMTLPQQIGDLLARAVPQSNPNDLWWCATEDAETVKILG